MAEGAFVRALELIDLTLKFGRLDSPYRGDMLKEPCKVRELFCSAYEEADVSLLMWLDKYFGDSAILPKAKISASLIEILSSRSHKTPAGYALGPHSILLFQLKSHNFTPINRNLPSSPT